MRSKLLLLSVGGPTAPDQSVQKFAEFLGVQTESLCWQADGAQVPGGVGGLGDRERCVGLSFATLKSALPLPWFGQFLRESKEVLVYGFSTADTAAAELQWLTQGAIASLRRVEARKKDYSVSAGPEGGNFPVCGKSFAVESASVATAFAALPSHSGFETWVAVNGLPYAVCGRFGAARLVCLAETCLVDLESALAPRASLREWYGQFVALAMFLRSAFGASCWTSPVRGATVILDDPSLKSRYGFVCYDTLLAEVKRLGCAVSIGFIPYNYRRSDARTVRLLRSASDRFSIAVHGCDHTWGEFASLDQPWLMGLAQCARERMEAHSQLTQMPYDDVMIFPQGLFSTGALQALKECGYLAAVNTFPWPVGCPGCALRIRDLLDMAVTQPDGFSLFTRRDAREAFDCAFDALFQKPLLIGEHHGYFQSGYESFAGFVRQISALPGGIAWMPLRRTLVSSCLQRQMAEARYQVRFVTPVLRFKNPSPQRGSFLFVKRETSQKVVGVLWEGQDLPFKIEGGSLLCEAELEPGQEGELRVVYGRAERVQFSPSLRYRGRVCVRRLLSDLRDNYLSRSRLLLAAAEKARRLANGKR